jgi:hypothetical protein
VIIVLSHSLAFISLELPFPASFKKENAIGSKAFHISKSLLLTGI